MRGTVLLVACATMLALPLAAPVSTVYVAVEDAEGRPVENLTAADF